MAAYNESFRVRVVEFLRKGQYLSRNSRDFWCIHEVDLHLEQDGKTGKNLKFEFVPRSLHRVNYEELLAYVKEHPDAYLRDISAYFSAGITTIWTALKRLGVKKTQNLSRSGSGKTQKIYRIPKKLQKR